MKTKIFKIVVGSLTTISLIFTFIFVRADTQYYGSYGSNNSDVSNFLPNKPLSSWELPRDFDGQFLALNSSMLDLSNVLGDGGWISIQFPVYNDYVQYPSISYQGHNVVNGNIIYNNYTMFHQISGLRLISHYEFLNSPTSAKLWLQYLENGEWITLRDLDFYKRSTDSSLWADYYVEDIYSYPLNNNFIKSIQFPLRANKQFINYQYYSNLEDFGSYETIFEMWLAFFKSSSVQIYPSAYIEKVNDYFNNEKISYGQQKYEEGYQAGMISNDGNYRFSFLTGVFNAISDILSIQIFPNVTLGYFVLIPLALGITGMILWFWRKD